jgi:hypothetical protein
MKDRKLIKVSITLSPYIYDKLMERKGGLSLSRFIEELSFNYFEREKRRAKK